MDWHCRNSSFFERDLSLLRHGSGSTSISSSLEIGSKIQHQLSHFDDNASLETWLGSSGKDYVGAREPLGVLAIFCSRANPARYNPQGLLRVPFSAISFKGIRSILKLDISIVRVLNRGAAVFSRTFRGDQVSYNLRMCNEQDKDLAMSVTTNLKIWSTRVLILGCLDADIREFFQRLNDAGNAIKHPMLFPGLFAEFERKRHVELVRSSVTTLLESILTVGDSGVSASGLGHSSSNDLLKNWINITSLSSSLETWKAQLSKMINHIDELNDVYFHNRLELRESGKRIKERLVDIIEEYEELRRKCALVIDGTSLANGMASIMSILWNRLAQQDNALNRKIAQAAKQDGSQMKSIAFLAMLFLPGTYLSSLFAMQLFNWHPDLEKGEKIYSGYFWIYWVSTGTITSTVIALWVLWSRFSIKRSKFEPSASLLHSMKLRERKIADASPV